METIHESDYIDFSVTRKSDMILYNRNISRASIISHSNEGGFKTDDPWSPSIADNEDVFYETFETAPNVFDKQQHRKSKRFSTISTASTIAILAPFFKGNYNIEEPKMQFQQPAKRPISFVGFTNQLNRKKSNCGNSLSLRINPERISMYMQKAAASIESLKEKNQSFATQTMDDWCTSLESTFEESEAESRGDWNLTVPDYAHELTAASSTASSSRSSKIKVQVAEKTCEASVDPVSSIDNRSFADSSLTSDEPAPVGLKRKRISKRFKLKKFFKTILAPLSSH